MNQRAPRRAVLTALAAAALAGCATAPLPEPSGESRAPGTGAGAGQGAATPATAAGALVLQGANERRAGDYRRAEATLERALRVDPSSPAVWLELARVRLAQGDFAQAEQLALKAESLADPESPLAEECRALRAEARQRQRGS
jgi:Tfp pilus assembly protein PilF